MKRLVQSVVLFLFMGIATQPAWPASPCDNVDRNLTYGSKAALAPVIAKQLHTKKIDVLQAFRFDGWTILYVNTHYSDETFLFYPHDPLHTRYVTMWSGAARIDETQNMTDWTLKSAPGIPPKLAGCFAWHVTKDRDQ